MKELTKTLIQISIFFCVGWVYADSSGLTKIQKESDGTVNLPITGTGNTYWLVLNQCYLDKFGIGKAGEKVSYRPIRYGDIFFYQQFSGDEALFAEKLVLLKLIGSGNQCKHFDPKDVSAHRVSLTIKDVYEWMKKNQSTLTETKLLSRFPKSSACPTTITDSNLVALSQCLDISAIKVDLANLENDILEKYPSPPITPEFTATNYAIRKPFSTMTAKTSIAFVPGENTAINTVYISVYPFVELGSSEFWAGILDRVSLDVGVAKPTGDTANENFKSAEQHYLFGLGFDLSESFSFHVSNVLSYHKEHDSENDVAIGVSLDIGTLINKLNN